jgi:peptide methionine sulfoxide reductase MsrB
MSVGINQQVSLNEMPILDCMKKLSFPNLKYENDTGWKTFLQSTRSHLTMQTSDQITLTRIDVSQSQDVAISIHYSVSL